MDRNNDVLDKAIKAEGLALWRGLKMIDNGFQEVSLMGVKLTSINVRGPRPDKTGFLATLKLEDESGGQWVAFRGGDTLNELIGNIAKGWEEGTLTIKENVPYAEYVKRAGGR